MERDISVVSDAALASKMPRGSGLSQDIRAQVLYNSGGLLNSERVESCLKNMHGQFPGSERQLGATWKPRQRPNTNRAQWRQASTRDQQRRFQPRGSRDGGKWLQPRARGAYLPEDANDDGEQEECKEPEEDGNAGLENPALYMDQVYME